MHIKSVKTSKNAETSLMSVYQCTPNEQAERDLIALDLFVILSILLLHMIHNPSKGWGINFLAKICISSILGTSKQAKI